MKELVLKIAKIQKELKAPKNQYNSFGDYRYRSCEDILEAVKPLLGDLILTITDDVVEVGGRVYVKATACITDGEESISNTAFAREAETRPKMDVAQLTGAASSYARKYALNGLFCIDDVKDPDATNHHEDDRTPSEKAKETRELNKLKDEELNEKAAVALKFIEENKNRELTIKEKERFEWLLREMTGRKACEELGNQLAKAYADLDKMPDSF